MPHNKNRRCGTACPRNAPAQKSLKSLGRGVPSSKLWNPTLKHMKFVAINLLSDTCTGGYAQGCKRHLGRVHHRSLSRTWILTKRVIALSDARCTICALVSAHATWRWSRMHLALISMLAYSVARAALGSSRHGKRGRLTVQHAPSPKVQMARSKNVRMLCSDVAV